MAVSFFAIMIAIGSTMASETKPLTTKEQASISQSDIAAGNDGQSFTPQKESMKIVNGIIEVKAGGYIVYPLTVPKSATDAQLSGTLTSSEGGINILLMDGWKYNAWKDKQMTFNLGGVYYRSEDMLIRGHYRCQMLVVLGLVQDNQSF